MCHQPLIESTLYGDNRVLIVAETVIQLTHLHIRLAEIALRSIGFELRQILAIGLGEFSESIQQPDHALSLVGADRNGEVATIGLAAAFDLIQRIVNLSRGRLKRISCPVDPDQRVGAIVNGSISLDHKQHGIRTGLPPVVYLLSISNGRLVLMLVRGAPQKLVSRLNIR